MISNSDSNLNFDSFKLHLFSSLATDGFLAYDCEVDQEVLVMVVVLCYLGDSPMHAEICNCINPGVTLTPCRICNLRVDSKADKMTKTYVQQFIGLDERFEHVCRCFHC
jgi:hypothetical protein